MHRGNLHISDTKLCAGGRRNEGVCEVCTCHDRFILNYFTSLEVHKGVSCLWVHIKYHQHAIGWRYDQSERGTGDGSENQVMRLE